MPKRPTKSGVWVGRVPAEMGTFFFLTTEPAIASTGTITKKRPIHIAMPIAVA
jgi:hypothetical protein